MENMEWIQFSSNCSMWTVTCLNNKFYLLCACDSMVSEMDAFKVSIHVVVGSNPYKSNEKAMNRN